MSGHLVAIAVAAAGLAGALSWFVAARIGWRWAVALPVLALLASIGLLLRSSGMGLRDGLGLAAAALVFALPALVGAGLGIGAQVWRRRRSGLRDLNR